MLPIVFENDHLIAINKPHDLLVHKSPMASEINENAVHLLRDQVGYHVFPVHRLDRKTSGILLFAKNKEYNTLLQQKFMNKEIQKTYHAVVRGFVEIGNTIDYALKNENGNLQDAITHYSPLQQFEIDLPHMQFPTSRYSLVELKPETGRFRQLRKHMAHIFHPIIGDRPHGCNKQNRLWDATFGMRAMLLHAVNLKFEIDGQNVFIEAPYSKEMRQALEMFEKRKVK